jgi:5-methylcytosine-specific restriction endonuclease McrA
MRANEAAPEALVTPMEPRLINLLRRFFAMSELYHADQHSSSPSPEKRCIGPCGLLLPATSEFFPRDKNRKDGLFPHCKACKKEYDRVHHSRPEIRDKRHAQMKAHYHSPEVYEQRLAHDSIYRNQPEVQERIRTWRNRPDVYSKKRAHNANRYARKKAIPGTHTSQQVRDLYDRQKGKCYYCRQKVEWSKHHVDHTFPLSREGARNSIDHLVITCATCNLKKHDKYPWEFPEGGRLL